MRPRCKNYPGSLLLRYSGSPSQRLSIYQTRIQDGFSQISGQEGVTLHGPSRILHRFRDIAFDMCSIAIFVYTPLAFNPRRRGSNFLSIPWDDLRKILHGSQLMARKQNDLETLPKTWNRLSRVHERYRRQTDGSSHVRLRVTIKVWIYLRLLTL